MKKKVHKETEIVKTVKKLGSGMSADVVAREYGISRATLYNRKSKCSGMEVRQIEQLWALKNENYRLKQTYADITLDNKILSGVLGKFVNPEVKKKVAMDIVQEYGVMVSV